MSTKTTVVGHKKVPVLQHATSCDVCGREYTDAELVGFETWNSEMEFYWRQNCPDGISTGFCVEDVCPDCAEKIRDFVESLGGKVSEPFDGRLAEKGALHRPE